MRKLKAKLSKTGIKLGITWEDLDSTTLAKFVRRFRSAPSREAGNCT